MASQETHTSIENHASSPIPSNEAEEEEDPAQLVAHITPKSPAQIVTIINALIERFCDWHHSENPSQGKLVRRDVYPHLGLGLRKTEPRQNAYNTWLHHEGSKYKTSGSGREAFDWDRVSEDWERFQQQDNWREKIALMEAENPSRSQVAKAAAKKLKRRQGPSEDGVTHHDIDYYYDGLNELKRSFCDLATEFHSLFGIHSIIYMALDHEHASIKDGCLTAVSTKELESFLAEMGRDEPAADAADMLRWLQFKNRQRHGLETSEKIRTARTRFLDAPTRASSPADPDASPSPTAQSSTPLPPLYSAADESKKSRASKSILKTGKGSRSASRPASQAETSGLHSADGSILEFDVKKTQNRQVIKATLCCMLSLATNGRLGDTSKILEWEKLHQDLFTSNLRLINLPACIRLPGEPTPQEQKSNTKPHNWTLAASNAFLQAVFHPDLEKRCMLVCAASGLNPSNCLLSRTGDDGVAKGRLYDGFVIDDTQNVTEKCGRCGACTNAVPLPAAEMGGAWPGVRGLLHKKTREKLLASESCESAAGGGPSEAEGINPPTTEALGTAQSSVGQRVVHFTPPHSSLAEDVVPDSLQRRDSHNIPAATSPPNLSALAAYGSPSEHQAAGPPSFSPLSMPTGPTTDPDNPFDLSRFPATRTRPSSPTISPAGVAPSQLMHVETAAAVSELAPPSSNALTHLQTPVMLREEALGRLPRAANNALMTPASHISAHLIESTSNDRTPLNLDAWLHPSVFTSPDPMDKPHALCNEVHDFDEDYEQRPILVPLASQGGASPSAGSSEKGRKRGRGDSDVEGSDSESERVERLPKLPRLDLSSEQDELDSSVYGSGGRDASGASEEQQIQRQIAALQAKLQAAQGRPKSVSRTAPFTLEAANKTAQAGVQSIRTSVRENEGVGGAVTELPTGRTSLPKPPLRTYGQKNRAVVKDVAAHHPRLQEARSLNSGAQEDHQARPLRPFTLQNGGNKPSIESPHRIAMQSKQDEAARKEESERRVASEQLSTRRRDLVDGILRAQNATFVLERYPAYQDLRSQDHDYLRSCRECQEAKGILESNIHEARAARLQQALKEKEGLVRKNLTRLREAFLSQVPLNDLETILKNAS